MTTKITVSLPDAAVAAAKKAVAEGRAASVSAYVAHALTETYGDTAGGKRPLLKLLDELEAEYGPPSEEDRHWARVALGLE